MTGVYRMVLNRSTRVRARSSRFWRMPTTTKATRQRQLSALRQLAQMLYILDPSDDHRRIVEALKLTKAPTGESSGHERTRKALTPAEADKMLRVWNGSRPADVRNRALVALLLLGGIRRSEAAGLRWQDVDFENGVLYIRHSKGDKERDVPLAGDYALDALRAWQRIQPSGYQWVFCSVNKGGNAGKDKPVTGTDVYRIWAKTSEHAGIDCLRQALHRLFHRIQVDGCVLSLELLGRLLGQAN
jgi:integrase/recombinase XerD